MSGAESRLQGLAVIVAGRLREDGGWNRQLLHLWVAAAGVAGCPGGQQAEAAEWLGPADVPGCAVAGCVVAGGAVPGRVFSSAAICAMM
ncbi:hypothetical protein CYMTET_51905 [Cymbomonas tetramitiformis]|uniref:Uncharacterized protein n=1 Tax=Cymbomonas tetramitiformis TaxID=36881 RepID=A0AAE0ERW2_9CHLO|nr:hypothetical protein CYMTET_51905 [Cymbomonas tetramitiformis]